MQPTAPAVPLPLPRAHARGAISHIAMMMLSKIMPRAFLLLSSVFVIHHILSCGNPFHHREVKNRKRLFKFSVMDFLSGVSLLSQDVRSASVGWRREPSRGCSQQHIQEESSSPVGLHNNPPPPNALRGPRVLIYQQTQRNPLLYKAN